MKKIIFFIIFGLSILGCSKLNSNTQETSDFESSLIQVDDTAHNILTSMNVLKDERFSNPNSVILVNTNQANLISDNGNSYLHLDNTVNHDQYIDTQVDLKTLDSFSISLWFRTKDLNKVQTLLWIGYTGGNGWGEGTSDPLKSEFNVNLNHWGNSDGVMVSTFYGYNEQAISPDLTPVSSPYTYNETDSSFSFVNQNLTLDFNWHNLIVIVDKVSSPIQINTYYDGRLISSVSGTQIDISGWDQTLKIGKPGSSQRLFDGYIDNLLIFDKKLSPSEVSIINNRGMY